MIETNDKVRFLSDKYKATVLDGERRNADVCVALLADGTTNNIELPSDIYAEYNGLGMGTKTIKTYYSNIEFESDAKIEVVMPSDVKQVKIKPNRYSKQTEFADGKVIISAKDKMNFYIEPNGNIFEGIHIFCNKRKEYENDKKHLIEFKDGVYTSENCEYIKINEFGTPVIDCIQDDTVVYIANGATVNAAFVLSDVKNVRICGNGEISLVNRCHGADECFKDERYWGAFRENALPNVYVKSGCENIEINDVVLNCEFRGIVIRNSKNINIDNVKIFSSTENADGINCVNTSELTVDGCYIQSADDCFCMYNSCDSILWFGNTDYLLTFPLTPNGLCENVEVKNCIMASNARPFVLGGHATGEKNPRCEIRNIYIHDCEIIDTPYRIFGNTREYAMYWSGLMRILSQSEQLVSNITFENMVFDVTKGHNGKAVHIEVRNNSAASYTESNGFRIENIAFKNISVKGSTEDMIESLIKCSTENGKPEISKDYGICGVEFENVIINNQKLNSGNIIMSGNVNEVKIN